MLIGLCVVGCLTLDLTLLQTALLEMSKTIGTHLFLFLKCSCVIRVRISVRVEQWRRPDAACLLSGGSEDNHELQSDCE